MMHGADDCVRPVSSLTFRYRFRKSIQKISSTKNRNSFDSRKSKLVPNAKWISFLSDILRNKYKIITCTQIEDSQHYNRCVASGLYGNLHCNYVHAELHTKSIRSGQKEQLNTNVNYSGGSGSGTAASNECIGTELRAAWKYAYVWIYTLHDALPNSHGRCYSTEDNTKIRNKNTKITCEKFFFCRVWCVSVCLCLTLGFVHGHWRDTTTEIHREHERNETVSLHCWRLQMCTLTHTISVHNLKHVLFAAEAAALLMLLLRILLQLLSFSHSTFCIFAMHLHCSSRPDSISTQSAFVCIWFALLARRSTKSCWFCCCCFIGSPLAYLLCYVISDDCFHNAIVDPVDTFTRVCICINCINDCIMYRMPIANV